MKHDAKVGDTVELKDKDTGFYDPETNFSISRNQQIELEDNIGRLTGVALASGALLVVGDKKSSKKNTEDNPKDTSKSSSKTKSDLPDDLPGRDAFIAAGVSFEQLKKMNASEVEKIKGFDKKDLDALDKYMSEALKK